MTPLPIEHTAYGPWGPVHAADPCTCRAAARVLADGHSSGAVSLTLRVRDGKVEGRLGLTAIGGTDRDARSRAREGLRRQGLEPEEQASERPVPGSFRAAMRPVTLPDLVRRLPVGKGLAAIRAELLRLPEYARDPTVRVQLRANHEPGALLAAVDLAHDLALGSLARARGAESANVHRPNRRRSGGNELREAFERAGPQLTLTAWVAADSPIAPVPLHRLASAFADDLGLVVEFVASIATGGTAEVPLSVLGEVLGLVSPYAEPGQANKLPPIEEW